MANENARRGRIKESARFRVPTATAFNGTGTAFSDASLSSGFYLKWETLSEQVGFKGWSARPASYGIDRGRDGTAALMEV